MNRFLHIIWNALLFAVVAYTAWLVLREPDPRSLLSTLSGRICTPSINALRLQAQPPLELPAQPFAPAEEEEDYRSIPDNYIVIPGVTAVAGTRSMQ